MALEGYIRLAGKVLFDDICALKPKREHAELQEKKRAQVSETSSVEREGTRAGREPDEPRIFVAKTEMAEFTGFCDGVWFDAGEAVLNRREAARLELRGYSVQEV